MSPPTAPSVENPSAVELNDVEKRFAGYTAVEGITLDVPAGRFVSIVGPSGCGKSTVLNLIAGLLAPSDGTVTIFGEPLAGINRRASYMFQQDALLPWKTVLDNIRLGLDIRGAARRRGTKRGRGVGRTRRPERLRRSLSVPAERRHAKARRDGAGLDRPTGSGPDGRALRRARRAHAAAHGDRDPRLWADSDQTVIFVTHDLEEAISLSDEVVVLSAGPASRVVGRYPVDLDAPERS